MESQLIEMSSDARTKSQKAVKIGAVAAAGAIGVTYAPNAVAQTYTVTDAVAEVTAVPDALGTVVGGFTVLAVAVMGVTYAVRLGKRIRP